MRLYKVGVNDGGQRLDKYLSKLTVGMPKSLLYKYIRQKCVKVNGKRAEASQVVNVGDEIKLFISDEFFADKGEDGAALAIESIKPKLTVVYEDDNIMICDKPVGVLVHSGDADGEASDDKNTLIGHIQAYLYRKGEYDPRVENTFAPALCNRIDRNTRGLVLAAKNAAALREMNEIIKERLVKKYYLCAVHGKPYPEKGTLRGYLRREGVGVRVYDKQVPGSKEIVTKYRVLKTAGKGEGALSLCEIDLVTGRTHQIRAHLESMGHPLLGEGRYGKNLDDRKRGYKSQALCAYRLTFALTGFDGTLSYLDGKSFSVDKSTLDFMREFE